MDPFGDLRNVYPHGMGPQSQCVNRHIRPSGFMLVDSRFTVARVISNLVCARRCTRLVIRVQETSLFNVLLGK